MSARLSWMVCLIVVLAAFAGSADAQARGRPTVLVMESSAGLSGATKLRAVLSKQLGVPVVSASEVSAQGPRPTLLAVAVDRTRGVTVVYVGEQGDSDSLSAPLPADGTTLEGVVTALAAAILQRHLFELTAPAQPARPATSLGSRTEPGALTERAAGANRYTEFDVVKASRILHAALLDIGAVRRRSGMLRADDF